MLQPDSQEHMGRTFEKALYCAHGNEVDKWGLPGSFPDIQPVSGNISALRFSLYLQAQALETPVGFALKNQSCLRVDFGHEVSGLWLPPT